MEDTDACQGLATFGADGGHFAVQREVFSGAAKDDEMTQTSELECAWGSRGLGIVVLYLSKYRSP